MNKCIDSIVIILIECIINAIKSFLIELIAAFKIKCVMIETFTITSKPENYAVID